MLFRSEARSASCEEVEDSEPVQADPLPMGGPILMERSSFSVRKDITEVLERAFEASETPLRKEPEAHAAAQLQEPQARAVESREEGTRKIIRVPWSRNPSPGESTIGVESISFRARIASMEGADCKCKLDSGADISLISQEFLNSLPEGQHPSVRRGLRMNLFQLTNGFKIEGYTHFYIYAETKEGALLELLTECYVVPGMQTPVLLGEEFHLNYEMHVMLSISKVETLKVCT